METKKKTKLCKFYSQNKCKYGKECNYAHGQDELKQKDILYEIHQKFMAQTDEELLAQMSAQDLALNMLCWDKEDRDYCFIDAALNGCNSDYDDFY